MSDVRKIATRQQCWERVQALLAPHIPLGLVRSQLIDAIMEATAEPDFRHVWTSRTDARDAFCPEIGQHS